MRGNGYVNLEYFIERVNREKPNVGKYSIPELKEWIWEAIRKIGGESAYSRNIVRMPVENGVSKIPNKVKYIREIRTKEGQDLIETRDSLENNEDILPRYLINGTHVFTNAKTEELVAEILEFPVDSEGNPKVIDNEYVIQGVVSYALERIARKMWINNQMQDNKYNMINQEWLFYVSAASNSLSIPSLDGMKEWRFLHEMTPGYNNETVINKKRQSVGNYERPPYLDYSGE